MPDSSILIIELQISFGATAITPDGVLSGACRE